MFLFPCQFFHCLNKKRKLLPWLTIKISKGNKKLRKEKKKERKKETLALVDNQEILTRSARSAKIKGDTSLTRYFSNLKRNGPVIICKTEFRNENTSLTRYYSNLKRNGPVIICKIEFKNENTYFTKLKPNIVLRNPLISVVGKECVLLVFR